MKKFLCALVSFIILLSTAAFAEAEGNITVTVDGAEVLFDSQPFIENNRVLVPFRAIFEALGCEVVYYGDSGSVYAYKGNKNVSIDIGSDIMYVDGAAITIDVPSKIINDRTFVPVRAISEGMDAAVSWLEASRTVKIESKQGQHYIKSLKKSQSHENKDGVNLLNISCSYPIIENDEKNEYIDALNESFAKSFDSLSSEYSDEMLDMATEEYEYLNTEGGEREFIPYEVSQSFGINTDRNNLLSFTNYGYYDSHGAHPSSWRDSFTYDLVNKKQLELSDILNINKDEIGSFVVEAFRSYVAEYGSDLETLQSDIEAQKDAVSFYLTDNSLVLYFNVYQVGPYAMGYPETEIPFKGNEDKFKVSLGDAKLDSYTVSLRGNPTTGYAWQKSESDKVLISDYEYVPDNNDTTLSGSGGTFNFNVTGLLPGKCTVEFSYSRSWEDNAPLQTEKYVFFVSDDKKITLLNHEPLQHSDGSDF